MSRSDDFPYTDRQRRWWFATHEEYAAQAEGAVEAGKRLSVAVPVRVKEMAGGATQHQGATTTPEPVVEPITITVRTYHRERPWVARVSGTDDQYGLSREFVRGVSVRSNTGQAEVTLVPGLYQVGGGRSVVRDLGEYFLVAPSKKGTTELYEISEARAKAIAKLLSDGHTFTAARKATFTAARKATK